MCVKILIMQSVDKTCTCNWESNKVKAGQIDYIYNILLPHLFHPVYYTMRYGSVEDWNLFYAVGLVDCWH